MKSAKLFALVFLVFEGVAALPAPPQGLLRAEDSEPRFMPRKATDEHQHSSADQVFARGVRESSPDLASSAWFTRATQDDDAKDTDFQGKQRFLVRQLMERDESALDRRQRSKKVVIGTLLGLAGLGTGGYFAVTKLLKKEKDEGKKQQQQQQPLPDGPPYSGGGCSPTGVGCRRDVMDNKRHDVKSSDEEKFNGEAILVRGLQDPSPDLASSARVARAAKQDDGPDAEIRRQRFLVRRLLQARSSEDERDVSTLDARQHSPKNVVIGALLGLAALGTGGYFAINKFLKDKKERERKKQQQQQQQFLPEDPAYSGGGCRRDVTDRQMHESMSSEEQSEDRLTARTARSWTPGRKTFAAGSLLTLAGLGLASYLGYKALNPGSKGQNPPPQFGQTPPPRRRDLGEGGDDGNALEEKRDGAYLAVRC
ncbi:hypothetical protein BCV69DRAFT_278090 [Microstroma glucosiphilum]|uniref:Mid2 domain-containing protein n=1 Tax=Pseudomicrostroma glucosiphilum TaxID=1684307 RepID=A0A316U3U6_9BASI|nr:hypothetical protein BCV69DRAFT_278090 [Pseudomicrostroma glucosiphilum]PWN19840.1 hypothetical protein BCV69DRAFT_278090 [Pseudomicrostroma glucosiphilum]